MGGPHGDDVVEVTLLLVRCQWAALEEQAHRDGVTAGCLLRRLVAAFLAGCDERPGPGPAGGTPSAPGST
jgi:hypothetical protein